MLADLEHCTSILYFKGAFKYLFQRSGISLAHYIVVLYGIIFSY